MTQIEWINTDLFAASQQTEEIKILRSRITCLPVGKSAFIRVCRKAGLSNPCSNSFYLQITLPNY